MFFMPGNDTNPQDWRYFWNGMWCIVVAMATVGFGEFYPVSVLGRVITIIACFWGTFLMSLMVAALTLTVEFNSQEELAYQSIRFANFEIDYGETATLLLQRALRYYWHLQTAQDPELDKNNAFRRKKSKLFTGLKTTIVYFRRLRRHRADIYDEMTIGQSLNKIDNNISVEMSKLKLQFPYFDQIKGMLEEYSKNQQIIKGKAELLYNDLQEMNNFKDKFLSENNES